MGLGIPEMIMISVVVLLFFGPGVARAIGRLGGTALSVKREIDGAKSGLTKQLTQGLDNALRGPKKPEGNAPPKSEGPGAS